MITLYLYYTNFFNMLLLFLHGPVYLNYFSQYMHIYYIPCMTLIITILYHYVCLVSIQKYTNFFFSNQRKLCSALEMNASLIAHECFSFARFLIKFFARQIASRHVLFARILFCTLYVLSECIQSFIYQMFLDDEL